MAFPSTGMFGRDAELDWLRSQLDAGAPLVTLTGPPGIGKTHLARAFAAELGNEALFCEAMHATDADSLCLSMARVLKLSLGQDSSLEARAATIGSAIQRYQLVVLDNLEHIIAEAAPLVRQWMGSGRQLLVTSRNALAVRGEQLLELHPLSEEAAVQLFDERVRQIRPKFELDAVRESVQAIARELDRVPLALELAAGRSRVLDPPALLERLRDRFALLRSRERFGQWSTLEQAIDWSWQLLAEDEQRAAAECTVFRGSFDLEAAERVLEGEQVLEELDALRDKSMLIATGDERLRLGMLSSIRAFCADKLSAEQLDVLRRRHAVYFGEIAERFGPAADAGHLPSVQALALCQDELQAVAERFRSTGEQQPLVAACIIASAALVETQGVPNWLESAFDHTIEMSADAAPALSSRLYLERSTLRRLRGALDLSRSDAKHALTLCKPESALAGQIHRRLGMLDVDSGNLDGAVKRLERACKIYAEAGDERSLGIANTSLARALYAVGEHEKAEALCERALKLHAAAGLAVWEGLTHGYLAYICMDAERYVEAESQLERSVSLFRSLGSDSYEGAFVGLLGTLRHLQGQLDAALKSFAEACEAMQRSGRRRLAAIHRGNEGIVLLELGRLVEADERLKHAIDELKSVGDEASAELFSAHAAGSAIAAGNVEHAARLLNATGHAEGAIGEVLTLQRAKLRLAISDPESAEFRDAAKALRLELSSREADGRGDVRIAIREVARFLGDKTSTRTELRVAKDGSWFEVNGERHDLRSREVLSKMVLALTEVRLSGEAGLGAADLIAATWPGELMTDASATSRLHSTVRRLRKMGLSDLLLHEHGEYRLSQGSSVAWAD